MDFTPNDVMKRMESYLAYAHQVKEIKDLLLDFEIYGDEDLMEASSRHQDELIKEIHAIYQERMVPLVEEIAVYVNNNMHILNEAAQPAQERETV